MRREREPIGEPEGPSPGGRPHVLFIGHDASRTGAPLVLLHLLRWLKTNGVLEFSILLGGGGPLEDQYRALAPTWVLSRELKRSSPVQDALARVPGLRTRRNRWRQARRVEALRRELREAGPSLVYANTVATLAPLEIVAPFNLPTILHVHELGMWIRHSTGLDAFNALKARTGQFVAVSEAVRRNLIENHGISPKAIELAHEFVETDLEPSTPREERRRRLCRELGIDPDAPANFVGASGTIDWRKGADLFVQLALRVGNRSERGRSAHFLWLGGDPDSLDAARFRYDAERAGVGDRVHLLGSRPDPADYIDLFDAFVLTSREDPYPLVVLEAAAQGKPIVCFADAGGAPEFVADDAGAVVPYLDLDAMADRVDALLSDEQSRTALGEAARAKVRRQHNIDAGASRVLEIIRRAVSPSPASPPTLATDR